MQPDQMWRGELRFLAPALHKKHQPKCVPWRWGPAGGAPACGVFKYLHTSNSIHCSSLHGQLSAGVEEGGRVQGRWQGVCMCACLNVSVWGGMLTGPSMGLRIETPYRSHSPSSGVAFARRTPPLSFTWAESLWTPASPNEDPCLHFHFWSHIRGCQAQNRPVSSEAWRAG